MSAPVRMTHGNQPWVVMKLVASIRAWIRTIPCHTYTEQWGRRVGANPSPKKNQFLIRTSSPDQREDNGVRMKTKDIPIRQIMYVLWFLSSCYQGILVVPSLVHLLGLGCSSSSKTSCSLSLDTSLPGCWFYFCPLLQAIHSAYVCVQIARFQTPAFCIP